MILNNRNQAKTKIKTKTKTNKLMLCLYPELRELGAFFRWLFKGCKSKLRHEVDNTEHDKANYMIGVLIVLLPVLTALILLFFGIIR